MNDCSVDLIQVKNLSLQQVADKLLILIVDLNLDLGRRNDQNISNHTSHRFAEYLKQKSPALTLKELDQFFYKIACVELGKVYEVSFASLTTFYKEFQRIKQESIKSNINNFVSLTNDNMKTSFIKDIYNKNPEQAKKDYPFLTSVLMTNENYKCGETKEDFFERSLRKLKQK